MNVHTTTTTTTRTLTRAEAREHNGCAHTPRTAVAPRGCSSASAARRAGSLLRAQEELADRERLDYELEHLFDRN